MKLIRMGCVIFAASAVAYGDEIHLKSGGKLEGKAKREGDKVVVETLTGTMTLSEDDVVRIDTDHRALIEEYYEKLAAAEKGGEAMAHLQLALWAREHKAHRFVPTNLDRAIERARKTSSLERIRELCETASQQGLGKEIRALWQRWLDLEPDHEKPRRALGYRNYKGVWVTEEEFEIAQGKIQFEGNWMSSGERDLILQERSLKLKERAAELNRLAKELDAHDRALAEAERSLKAALDRLAEEHRVLEDRERKVREQEDVLRRYVHCAACGFYYTGSHLCLKSWFYCAHCQGYFACGHSCGRK